MTFASLTFLAFLSIVFPIYWLLHPWLRIQNFFVLIASYVFYGWWDWRFLSLILISSFVDFICGLLIEKLPRRRKIWLIASIATNLGILGFFKYFNFFVDSAVALLQSIGLDASAGTLHVILPVGISFYTLQSMGYTIDVYRGQVKASHDPIAFFAYVSFFPQLVAGPIERAGNLLQQFNTRRVFQYDLAMDGMRQIGWGLFKKIMIADNLGLAIDGYFANPAQATGSELALATVFFAFQIYCDFSAYSDIAIGTGKLFGFRIRRNFDRPYSASSLRDFWSRWHMSLTTWLRDYVYVPLGGNRTAHTSVNIMAVFLLSGLWHGAAWTFIAWGAVHGFGLIVERYSRPFGMPLTILLVMVAWIFFRAQSIGDASIILSAIATLETITGFAGAVLDSLRGTMAIAVLLTAEWLTRDREHPLQFDLSTLAQCALYLAMIYAVVGYGAVNETSFIYFQF